MLNISNVEVEDGHAQVKNSNSGRPYLIIFLLEKKNVQFEEDQVPYSKKENVPSNESFESLPLPKEYDSIELRARPRI